MRSFTNQQSSVQKGLVLSLAVGLLAMTGCSGESAVSEENVASVEQAFGSSSCGTAAADQTFTSSINLASGYTSPSSYNTCYRGYVVDVNALSSLYDWYLRARWAGPELTTQASCEQAWGSAIFYKKVNGVWVDQSGVVQAYGQWFPAAGGLIAHCEPPDLGFTPQAGADWRIAATMRTQYGGSTLRAIWFQTGREPS